MAKEGISVLKTIRDINVEKLFPSVIYKRGLKYYRQGRVSDPLFDINYQEWSATVEGTENYMVEINAKNLANGSIDTYCNCPAFDTFGTCKHIAAVLIKIVNKDKGTMADFSSYDYHLTQNLMNALNNLPPTDQLKAPSPNQIELKVEYICKLDYHEQIQVEIKMGEKRCYVVKDARSLLEHIMEKREYPLTKRFSYLPELHTFAQEDMDLLVQLHAILQSERVYRSEDRFSSHQESKRFILIPPLEAKTLLEQMVKRSFYVDTTKENYSSVMVEKGKMPFAFSLSGQSREELLLKMDPLQDVVFLPHYELLFANGVFYFPEPHQASIMKQLRRFQHHHWQLPIAKNQADEFVSTVIPSLRKVGNVSIADNVAKDIVQFPLEAKLYLEVKGSYIVGKLEYHYGDERIDPFGGRESNDIIIIRDVEKEQQIMQLIEYADFHYNGKELYIHVDDEEAMYEFIYYTLPKLDAHVALFLTAAIRNLIVEQEPQAYTKVQVESSSNLLDIGFDIEGVNESEIKQILAAVIEKKRYYRLDNGALLSLENDTFLSMQQFFEDMNISTDDVTEGNMKVPVYRGVQIDELLQTDKNYDRSFRKLLHHLKSPEEQVYPLPELFVELRNYQETGYQWFKSLSEYHLGGILADDMGLGKTLQSISYIASEPGEYPHLIVAPSSVVYNWKNECAKFAPQLQVAVLTGTPQERKQKFADSKQMDVWITSYATVRQDIELYQDISFQTLILDEAQYIKNYATKTSKAIRSIQAGRRFALSGTPIENSIDELWAIFQVILPGLMPNYKTFKQLPYDKIAMITRPFILRRLKRDVLHELPEKIETVHSSHLTKDQKDLYIGYHRQLQQEAVQSMSENGFQKSRMKILAGLTRLRQICCHPSLFIENYQGNSGKLEQLMETVRNAKESGKRMLIFSQFTSMHEIIQKELDKEQIGYFYLHGQTPSQERVEMSERFNNGENDVFLISLKAGGTGLNLTGADTVILYDLWWNPAVEDQATGRAHRFGQKNVVQVIRLITEGTIEEKIYELQQKKRELIDQVIQPGEAMLSSLSENDVRELLNI
ncbi:DEAD/DEAH box helicase [Virgibacillus pantothenticus]|uniref:DEAD/DEAH box helicase n=1 Tax=Virgibacillus pantothenticus TaxID=1473 RepID=UPI002816099C|nr:DEAD/DEAH box helicase [Virgibacillus pantothenticus]MEB5450732.1 DEAD/DEAH box helicase [Virgibacillus pantothenticus]MEB5454752.1 DEAD/DEAH box helicase [Virgibacillus pantothenticus]MEB5458675.1 DEAD/DEAH box helicase [Virgibacillus pantothenticus]MEB5464248.1 DEAD/DEAH box helicase [Virgibacillus pantothenticus]MEB5468573.1 DEAD/DEAH box helicase [Virgibacillus pantothenticus]